MKYKEKHHKNCPNRNSYSKSDSNSFSELMLHFLSLDSLLDNHHLMNTNATTATVTYTHDANLARHNFSIHSSAIVPCVDSIEPGHDLYADDALYVKTATWTAASTTKARSEDRHSSRILLRVIVEILSQRLGGPENMQFTRVPVNEKWRVSGELR